MRNKLTKNFIWALVALLGAGAVGGIALNRGGSMDFSWLTLPLDFLSSVNTNYTMSTFDESHSS